MAENPNKFNKGLGATDISASEVYAVVGFSDTVPLVFVSREIRAIGSGTMRVRRLDGTTVDLPCADGEHHPVMATHIYNTGTSGVTGALVYF